MDLFTYIMLFAAAALAGAINSVAGGGTFLTFPLMMQAGLTPIQANVTSTIALWPGSLSGAAAYRQEWREHRVMLKSLLIISVAGGALGSVILLTTPEQVFRGMVPWLLLSATLIFTFGRSVIARLHHAHPDGETSRSRSLAARFMQFAIAVYGGYFGAGIGILMLAMLQLMGMTHIHRMNGLKTVLGSAINGVTVLIFVLFADVIWPVALVMVVGAVIGGYWGAAYARKLPPSLVRGFVSGIGFAMTAYYFYHG